MKTARASIVYLSISTFICSCSSHPAPDITVINNAEFNGEHLQLGFTVINNGDTPVPTPSINNDLYKNTRCLINGHPSFHLLLCNGPYIIDYPKYIPRGVSNSWGFGILLNDKGKELDNNTIQWEYLGVRSQILKIDIKNRAIIQMKQGP